MIAIRAMTIGLLLLILGCHRNSQVKTALPLTVKHCYATEKVKGWRVEVWLDGALQKAGHPVNVFVRLSPEHEEAMLPKSKVTLQAESEVGDVSLQRSLNPVFKDCALLPRDNEVVYKDGTLQAVTAFPTGPCWECSIQDAFKSDRRFENWTPIQPGIYVIRAEIILEENAPIQIELPPLKVLAGRDGPLD